MQLRGHETPALVVQGARGSGASASANAVVDHLSQRRLSVQLVGAERGVATIAVGEVDPLVAFPRYGFTRVNA